MCSCYRMPANAPTTATLMRAACIGRLMRNRRHTRRMCAILYNLSRGGVTEGCCPQAFSESATTRRANEIHGSAIQISNYASTFPETERYQLAEQSGG